MAPLEHAAQRAACPVLRSQVCACVCVVCAHGHVGAACGVENGQPRVTGPTWPTGWCANVVVSCREWLSIERREIVQCAHPEKTKALLI